MKLSRVVKPLLTFNYFDIHTHTAAIGEWFKKSKIVNNFNVKPTRNSSLFPARVCKRVSRSLGRANLKRVRARMRKLWNPRSLRLKFMSKSYTEENLCAEKSLCGARAFFSFFLLYSKYLAFLFYVCVLTSVILLLSFLSFSLSLLSFSYLLSNPLLSRAESRQAPRTDTKKSLLVFSSISF